MNTKMALLAGALAAAAASAAVPPETVDPILESASFARYLVVGDGPLAKALRERAPEVAPDLLVVPLRGVDPESPDALRTRAAEDAPTVRVRDAAELGPVPFLVAWLRDAPDSARASFAFADAPGAVSLAPGFDAVPHGAVWRVARAGEAPSPEGVAEFHEARDRAGEALAAEDGSAADPLGQAVRRHFSRLANDLGRRLALAGDAAGAREAFESAVPILPGAPSATLNLASLERAAAEADPAARARLARLLQNLRHAGGVLAVDCGVVMRPQDFFEAGWFWTLSGLPVSDTNAIAGAVAALPSDAPRQPLEGLMRVSFSLQRGNCEAETAFFEKRVGAEGLTPQLRLSAAETVMATTGDAGRAVALLERFAVPGGGGVPAGEKAGNGDLPFWVRAAAGAMNALARKGAGERLAALREKVSAAVASDPEALALARYAAFAPAETELGRWSEAAADFAAGPDGPSGPLAVAAAALARGGASAADAEKALAPLFADGKSGTWPAVRMRIEAAFARGDRDGAESAAKMLLALRPRDARAHWILGSVAMSRGDKAAAASHLQASVAERPVWYALNDLSTLMTETGRPDQGEIFARKALESGGAGVSTVHETLGEALQAAGRNAEAAEALRRAIAIAEKSGQRRSVRANLRLAEVLAAMGDAPGAAGQIAIVDADKDGLSVSERERLGEVRRAVSAALGGK